MFRDIVMIVLVVASVFSVGFAFYKNIESNINRIFIYEQAYEIIGSIQNANISSTEKMRLTEEALRNFGTPPSVIDLSRSSADVGDYVSQCTQTRLSSCIAMADSLARENSACTKSKSPTGPICAKAAQTKANIISENCFSCY